MDKKEKIINEETSFFFPGLGISIKAQDIHEATEKAQKIISNKNKDVKPKENI